MNGQRFLKAILVAGALMLAVPAGAQTVTAEDIQRLQDDVYRAGSDISRGGSDSGAVRRMQDELDELRDEVTYLKVKLRKDGKIDRREYADLRERVQDFRSRAGGELAGNEPGRRGTSSSTDPYDSRQGRTGTSSNADPQDNRQGRTGTSSSADPYDNRQGTSSRRSQGDIPEGQEIDVRLERELSSATAQVEDRFEATTVVDMYEGNRVLIPAGSVMRGVVSSVDKATRTDRRGSLTVAFDQVTVRGRDYPIRGTVTQALESEGIRGEAAKIGAGSAVGAIIGGIVGGLKGAVLGVLIGGGGTIAATEGKDVTLPPGTILRVSLETPPAIR
jgi:hypothetical protein